MSWGQAQGNRYRRTRKGINVSMKVFRSPDGSRIAIAINDGEAGIIEVASDNYDGAEVTDVDEVPAGWIEMR